MEHMTEAQHEAYLAATIRLKRIEQGIDPDTGELRLDWNTPDETMTLLKARNP
jgi:hypothetical protein